MRVDVADPLGLDAGAPERGAHHLRDAGRLGLRLRHVVRVVRRAVAEHLGVHASRRAPAPRRGPRARSTHAPSPITKPARVASNGREARGGSSSSTTSPRMAQKPARISGCRPASVPPASTASTSPRLISSAASPTACEPGGAGRDDCVVGTVDAERDRELAARGVDEHVRAGSSARPGRDRGSRRISACSRIPSTPPIAEPKTIPTRSGSKPFRPASSRASRAAASASSTLRSSLRTSFGDATGRVEVLDLGGDPDRKVARVEGADPVDAALARARRPPRGRHVVAERRDRAEPRDGDPPHRGSLDSGSRREVTNPQVRGRNRLVPSQGPSPRPSEPLEVRHVSGRSDRRATRGSCSSTRRSRATAGGSRASSRRSCSGGGTTARSRLYRVEEEERPDLLERFSVATVPTLVVVEHKAVTGRLEQPRGCRDIERFLAPWLN